MYREHLPSLTSESRWSYSASFWSVTSSGFSSLATQVPQTTDEEDQHRVTLLDPEIAATVATYDLTYSFSGVTTYTGSFATLTPTDGRMYFGVGNASQLLSGQTDGTFSESVTPASVTSGFWFQPVASAGTMPKVLLTYFSVKRSLGTLVNAGRFTRLDAAGDASGGVDFVWKIEERNAEASNYISINNIDPLEITSAMSIP